MERYVLSGCLVLSLVGCHPKTNTQVNASSTDCTLPASATTDFTTGSNAYLSNYATSMAVVDATHVLIGGNYFNSSQSNTLDGCSVFAYQKTGSQWAPYQGLRPKNPVGEELFGRSIDSSGSNVIIGAWGGSTFNQTGNGAAYIYKFDGSRFQMQQKLQGSDQQGGDSYGTSVSIDGNLAAVGAWSHNTVSTYDGVVYIYKFDGQTWSQIQRLSSPNSATPGDRFGTKVILRSNTLFVTAPMDDLNQGNAGSVRIYSFDGTQFNPKVVLQSDTPAVAASFGSTIGLSSDLGKLLIFESPSTIYYFSNGGGTWQQMQKWSVANAQANAVTSISMLSTRAAVGVSLVSNQPNNVGAVYVYDLAAGSWVQNQVYLDPKLQHNALFGNNVLLLNQNFVFSGYMSSKEFFGLSLP